MKSIIECIRDDMMKFPDLKDGCLLVDFLGGEAIEYSVEAVPCERIYRKYTDGGCMKQFLFLFASREFYSADVNLCIENLAFYENFENWIFERNQSGDLPDLDGRTPVSLEVLTGGYAFDADADTARYQIQLRLVYED
ncbi:MAG: hypothetical protein IJ642_12205 [Oscillospiraceae bacterium]|nr:hypothetical protein [Oscillospiraceae bacterium]